MSGLQQGDSMDHALPTDAVSRRTPALGEERRQAEFPTRASALDRSCTHPRRRVSKRGVAYATLRCRREPRGSNTVPPPR